MESTPSDNLIAPIISHTQKLSCSGEVSPGWRELFAQPAVVSDRSLASNPYLQVDCAEDFQSPINSSAIFNDDSLNAFKALSAGEKTMGLCEDDRGQVQPSSSWQEDGEHELCPNIELTAKLLIQMSNGESLAQSNQQNNCSSSNLCVSLSGGSTVVGMGANQPFPHVGYFTDHRSPEQARIMQEVNLRGSGEVSALPPSRYQLEPSSDSNQSAYTADGEGTHNKKPRKYKRTIDESRAIEPDADDVLFGRGGYTNTHAGNIRFRERALELRSWYEACSSKEEKYHVSEVLLESVTGKGHRFLEKGSDRLWHEVVGNGARKKASQALRERVLKERKKPPTSSPERQLLENISAQQMWKT